MNFTIRDFAPIKKADIKLDGLTVIAGDNDTGKSTVGKLIYSMVKGVRAERRNRPKELEDSAEANVVGTTAGFVTFMTIQSILGRINVYGDFGFRKSAILHYEGQSWHWDGPDMEVPFQDALMVETPLIFQLFDTFQGLAAEEVKSLKLNETFPISYPQTYFEVYSRLHGAVKTIGTFESEAIDRIAETISGKIVFQNNKPLFQRGEDSFPMQSVATGIQAFGFMQRILELGIAAPGQLLILDEPEVHLHPKWQLEYARLLVEMVDQLGLTVLLTTHSPVFVEAIDFIGRKKLGGKCTVYLSERDEDDAVVMKEVTEDLDQIYFSLGQPLVRLSMLQEDA